MDASWDVLEAQKLELLRNSVAPSTWSSYATGIRQYLNFCGMFSVNPLPLSEVILENFSASLQSRVAYKTIKVYLCGVQFWAKLHCCPVLMVDMHRLHYLLQGIRRVQGDKFKKLPRPPVTWELLQRICAFITSSEVPFNRDLYLAAVLLAFFGLLRVSEYTAPSSSRYDSSVCLCVQDVSICWPRGVALVKIKQSKTDPFRVGMTVRVGVIRHSLCPVLALDRYLVRRGPRPGPLFRFQNGRFLTRANVRALLKRCLPDVPHVNTHSFRRGGASALAAAGTPAHIIQVLGRWRSNAFTIYLDFPDSFVAAANFGMTKASPAPPQ